MNQFETIFNRTSIYNMVFVSIDSVLQYPTLSILAKDNPGMYSNWINIAENNYDDPYSDSIYALKALRYPEYNKIVSIAYGTIDIVNGEMKRTFKNFTNNSESFVIENFADFLNEFNDKNLTLCGFGLTKSRIPLLIKRILVNKKEFTTEHQQLPITLKKILTAKPWENDFAVDVDDVWKFNGMYTDSILSIANFLNLKTNISILSDAELSRYYWGNIESDLDGTIAKLSSQSLNKVNILMQLANELRNL